jgi:hypothetical protein
MDLTQAAGRVTFPKESAMVVVVDYEPTSLCGPVDLRVVGVLEERHGKKLDPSYVSHVQQHHGGIPVQRYVTDGRGVVRRIGRFLPLIDNRSDIGPPFQRSVDTAARDSRIDWGVLTLIEEDGPCSRRLFGGQVLLPFAALYRGEQHPDGMKLPEGEADLLAFSYAPENGRPAVVVWLAREAEAECERWTNALRAGKWEETVRYSTFTVPVAATFDEFLECLRAEPTAPRLRTD